MKIIDRYGGDITMLLPAAVFFIAPFWNTVLGKDEMLISYLYGITTLLVIVYSTFRHHQPIRITWVDVLLGIWLLYTILQTDKDNLPTDIFIYCVATYLWGRQLNPCSICHILAYAGSIQVLLLLLQLCDIVPSHHAYFPATGSFHNPGPLGGFLAVCLIAAIASFRQKSNRIWALHIFLQLIGLLLSDSRAAWVGALVGISYYVMARSGLRSLLRTICVISACIVFTLLIAFCYKPASAQGRIVIWKVSIEMIKAHPVLGQSLNSFSQNYMPQQARYIKEKATRTECHLMDNNRYAFNEFLCITCEQGFIGLLLVSAIFIMLWHASSMYISLRMCLLTYIAFSCFSYPLHVFFLQIGLFMICGCLSARSNAVWLFSFKSARIMFVTTSIIFVGILISQGWYVFHAQQAIHRFLQSDDMSSLDYLETHLSTFIHKETLLDSYAIALFLKEEYTRSIPILQHSINLFPATDKYVKLGNSFQSLAMYSQAENAYMKASQMLPDRIYPHFYLFMLYREMKQEEKAYNQATQMQHLFYKDDSELRQELLNIVHEYLQNSKYNSLHDE